MTDRELDDILYAALVVLNTPEYLELPDEPFPTSPEFEAKMENMTADPNGYEKRYRRAVRPLWRKVLTTAAAVLLVLSVSLAGVMAVSPTARAWVERVVVEWLEEYVGIHFKGEDQSVGATWRPMWLPDGFTEVDSDENTPPGYGYILYENGDGVQIDFNYAPIEEGNQFFVDEENSEYQEIVINGEKAYLFIAYNGSKYNFLVWSNSDKIVGFRLMSLLDSEGLIEIAKSVEIKK